MARHEKFRFVVLMVCLVFLSGWRNPFDTPAERNRKANELYREKNYDEALKKYSDAQLDAPDSPKLHYNLGTALFRKKDFKGAASEFQAAAIVKDKSIKSDALYNMGNAWFNLQNYQEAVNAYEGVLNISPEDKQASHNLKVAKKLLEEQKHEHDDKKEDQQKKDKKDKKDQSSDKDDSKQQDQKKEKEKKADQEEEEKREDQPLKDEQKDGDKTEDKQKAESAEKKPLDKDQMSQEEAKRILDALKNDELKFQRERLQQRSEVEVEKDW